jgi:hypothetical protein
VLESNTEDLRAFERAIDDWDRAQMRAHIAFSGSLGNDESRATYFYYDSLHRPTIAVKMVAGLSAPLPPGQSLTILRCFRSLPKI